MTIYQSILNREGKRENVFTGDAVVIDFAPPNEDNCQVYKEEQGGPASSVGVKIVRLKVSVRRELRRLIEKSQRNIIEQWSIHGAVEHVEDESYMAREPCQQSTFHNLVLSWKLPSAFLQNVLFQVTKELSVIHSIQESNHGNIKPSNILVSEDLKEAKLGDLNSKKHSKYEQESTAHSTGRQGPDSYKKATYEDKKADIFSLGSVFFFALSHGHDLQGKDAPNEGLNEKDLIHLTCPEKELAQDLIGKMLSKNISDRPTAEEVLIHPFFWSSSSKLEFYKQILDLSNNTGTKFKDELDKSTKFAEGWKGEMTLTDLEKCLDPILIGATSVLEVDDGREESVCGLLSFIADVASSLEKKDNLMMHALFPTPTDIWNFFHSRFPDLFMHIFSVSSAWFKGTGEEALRKYVIYEDGKQLLQRESPSDDFESPDRSMDNMEEDRKPSEQCSSVGESGDSMSQDCPAELEWRIIDVPPSGTRATIQNNHIVFPAGDHCEIKVAVGASYDVLPDYQPISSLFRLQIPSSKGSSSSTKLPRITAQTLCYADDVDPVPEAKILMQDGEGGNVHIGSSIELPEDREEVEFDWPASDATMVVLAVSKEDLPNCIFLAGGELSVNQKNEFMSSFYLGQSNGQTVYEPDWLNKVNFGTLFLKPEDEMELKLHPKRDETKCTEWMVRFDHSFFKGVKTEKKHLQINESELKENLEMQLDMTINGDKVRSYSFMLE